MKGEQIVKSWNKANQSNLRKAIICIVSVGLILGVYSMISNLIQRTKEKEYIVGTHNDVVRYVESAEITDKKLVISGWCFYPGVESEQNKVQVFLRNVDDEADTIWLNVEPIVRKDVNDYYDCDVDYSLSGFRASTKLKKVSLENKNYEILIKLTYYVDSVVKNGDKERITQKEYVKTLLTNRYLCNGAFTALLPEDEPVQTESGLLNDIFESGQLMLYDKGVYVYQYGTKMYWVAGKDFYLEGDGSTYIQFQLDTTRVDLLPKKRQEGGHKSDKISFYFEKNEIKDEVTEPYRVSVCDIPTEYPITRFWTGYYIDSAWVWRVYRTPDISKLRK